MDTNVLRGYLPALMTPCDAAGHPNTPALVRKGEQLVAAGMSGVIYCGSMGDWPLLTDQQRQAGVAALTQAGLPVIVGTGAVNTQAAVSHAAHAAEHGAAGLMIIPRVLSRGTSRAAQRVHFAAVLAAAPRLPAIIYNSPYYGFETKADLFFDLRAEFSNLVGFKEFGGAASLNYAAEHITGTDEQLALLVGVDTQVFHGYVNCGAVGAITGIGNALPHEVLRLVQLCQRAAAGDATARQRAIELSDALHVLSRFDEGPDLVLYYKRLLWLNGEAEYESHFNQEDRLSRSQTEFIDSQYELFRKWWRAWEGRQD